MTVTISSSQFAALVPRFTGGTSAISSSIIIFLIFRSEAKFGTIYHRIMFGMSIFDILSSLAISLTTLPMPKELPFPHGTYDGTRLGNIHTCEAQGFLYVVGFIAVFAYNIVLFVYYTCTIAFQMEDKKIAKYVEPILHIFPVTLALVVAIPPLVYDLYNPTYWDAWCTIAISGRDDVDFDEKRLMVKLADFDTSVRNYCIILFAIITCSIVLIVWRVIKLERSLRIPRIKRHSLNMNKVTKSLQNTKVVIIQVMGYLLSFTISLGILLIRSVIVEPQWMIYLSFVLIPLQGFFNAMIFISHKVYNYRRVHGDASRCDVIKLLFQENTPEPILFSRISMVMMNDNGNVTDIKLSNENGSEVLHINTDDIVSASQSGGNAWIDEESKQDLDLSGFSSVADPNSRADICSREGLSGFSDSLGNQQERTSLGLSLSLGAEESRTSTVESNNGSVLSRLMWTSRGGNRATNQSSDFNLES